MAYSVLFCFFILCISNALGMLFLGPCGPPPKHIDVDFKEYAGLWYAASTSAYDVDKRKCTTVLYDYKIHSERLNFVSGSKSGHLEKRNSSNREEIRQTFDNFPLVWHFHVLATDYDNVAVEYRCLDGALRKLEEVTVLTRQQPGENFDLSNADLEEVIPANLFSKLRPVSQKNCPVAALKPCGSRGTKPPKGGCNPLLPAPLFTLLASYANRLA